MLRYRLKSANMAGKMQTATRRLLNELQNYERDPSEALLHLAPSNDEDLTHWTAVLKGVQGTAYEGQPNHFSQLFPSTDITFPPPVLLSTSLPSSFVVGSDSLLCRWPMAAGHKDPRHLPQLTPHHSFRHADMPPECTFQDGGDLSRSA